MHINRRLFAASLAALFSAGLLVSCGSDNNSSSSTITQVVSFGDSLSDIGTYGPVKVMSTGVKFSTNPAPLWTEVVANAYGLPLKPASFVRFNKDYPTDTDTSFSTVQTLTGLSYAQGSARVSSMPISLTSGHSAPSAQPVLPLNGVSVAPATGSDVIIGYSYSGATPFAAKSGVPMALTAVSIKDQISNYLNTHNNAFSANQLVLIQGGANDLFVMLTSAGAALDTTVCGVAPLQYVAGDNIVTCAAKEMASQLKRLVDAGATHIVYANLPDVGNTPEFNSVAAPAGTKATVSALSAGYNATVTASLAALGITSNITVFDTAALLSGVITSPPAGMVSSPETKVACLGPASASSYVGVTSLGCASLANGGSGLATADAATTYLFADGVHPAQLGHRLWGDAAAALAASTFP